MSARFYCKGYSPNSTNTCDSDADSLTNRKLYYRRYRSTCRMTCPNCDSESGRAILIVDSEYRKCYDCERTSHKEEWK